MDLEEARKVLWLKSNPRALGELLDEGYLTLDRLKWAAQSAYAPRLQQAAQILLDSMRTPEPVAVEKTAQLLHTAPVDNSLQIGISLDKARATNWPFSPYKGQPMGMLVDAKQITLKDLGYAIENAWNENVKQAAIALMLVRLEQVVKEPALSDGYVHIVSGGRSYAERRQLLLANLQGAIFGIIFAFMIAVCINSFLRTGLSTSKPFYEIISTPVGLIALIIVVVGTVASVAIFNFISNKIFDHFEKQIEEYRFGQEGEEKTVQLMVQALDGNWNLFRNVNLPGRNKGDLDLVLVGPPGIWVLEVKNFNGQYRNIGENWEYRRGKTWKTASGNPSQQAMQGAVRLSNFLKADKISVFVNPAVVWANAESPLTVENPTVAVWLYERLPDELGNIWHSEKLSPADRSKITSKLSKLCEKKEKPK